MFYGNTFEAYVLGNVLRKYFKEVIKEYFCAVYVLRKSINPVNFLIVYELKPSGFKGRIKIFRNKFLKFKFLRVILRKYVLIKYVSRKYVLRNCVLRKYAYKNYVLRNFFFMEYILRK